MSVMSIGSVAPVFNNLLPDKKNINKHGVQLKTATDSSEVIDKLFAAHQEDLILEDRQEDRSFFEQVMETRQRALNLEQGKQVLNSNELRNVATDSTDYKPRYLEHYELAVLTEYLSDTKVSFKELDEFVENMARMSDNLAEERLAMFLDAKQYSFAQIYLVLNYLLGIIQERFSAKKRLKKLLMSLLAELENQESAYLCEFFSLFNHPSLKGKIELIDGLASVNSGNSSINSIKQMICFVRDSLNGEFDGLISVCMKKRVHILKRLGKKSISFEEKTELAEYLGFEKFLIMLHSIYCKVREFRKRSMEGRKAVILNDNYLTLINAIVNFADSANVSDLSINNMFKQIGLSSRQVHIGFINRLISLYGSLPIQVYNDNPQTQQKIMDGLRNTLRSSVENKEQSQNKFSFLKQSKDPHNFIKYLA